MRPRVTILPIILTKAHRVVVSMMAKGCLSTASGVFLFLLPNYIQLYAL